MDGIASHISQPLSASVDRGSFLGFLGGGFGHWPTPLHDTAGEKPAIARSDHLQLCSFGMLFVRPISSWAIFATFVAEDGYLS